MENQKNQKNQERVEFGDVEDNLNALSGKLNVITMALAQDAFKWEEKDIAGVDIIICDIQDHLKTVNDYCYQAFRELHQAKTGRTQ